MVYLFCRQYLKETHNIRFGFGSVFRTEKCPTYFTRRLASFSNLYTSSLDNLLQYSLNHTFNPRKTALPHEPDLNFMTSNTLPCIVIYSIRINLYFIYHLWKCLFLRLDVFCTALEESTVASLIPVFSPIIISLPNK